MLLYNHRDAVGTAKLQGLQRGAGPNTGSSIKIAVWVKQPQYKYKCKENKMKNTDTVQEYICYKNMNVVQNIIYDVVKKYACRTGDGQDVLVSHLSLATN